MKKLTSVALSLAVPAVMFSGLAAAEKPAKPTILHCGCAWDGESLEFVELNINKKAVGHNQHEVGDYETCATSISGSYNNFYRNSDDCQLSGTNISWLADCSASAGQVAGLDCD